MDKQYKLTDRVSKDSIKSPIFKKWVKRILCIACILSLSLQLTLCCLPMQASAAESDSVTGTYIINDVVDNSVVFDDTSTRPLNYILQFNGSLSGISFTALRPQQNVNGVGTVFNYVDCQFTSGSGGYTTCYSSSSGWYSPYSSRILTVDQDVIFNYSNEDVTALFSQWLSINTTKVIETVYDFTGETRIFNDELTLFNTSDATFTNSFKFDFDVLGVGTADYLILQRTTQNNYTMSYSFDFEDSGGLTMIYRDSPPFNNGEAEWLGGKVNRKVIKFLSNPENPDFQQWLLDNTTLFDDVNAAYQLGQQSGYNNGYEEGFANSLIGDSLSGPINALSQITLIEIQGTAITLGGVVMTAIALCLVLAFLKLYAGG